ncbi:MAG: hypothetical protein R3A78_08480 [Polyangiales bacterium]|nr:hypothetical protein [Myxococcales bacterium]
MDQVHLVADVADLKVLYRVLHLHLVDHPELLDVELFSEIQSRLQRAARLEGVDVTDHSAWDTWLSGGALLAPAGGAPKKREALN